MTTRTFGRYEVRDEIGRGGMATVFLAYDPRFKRDVALKVLPRQFTHDPMFRARFEREAQTIAALEHPAIVPVHDFGEEDGQPYLVMRYMSGGSLTDRLHEGALPLAQAATILERIAAALDRAHGMGVIHRDLKPGNILFDQYGDAFLADFGIAKLVEATAALTGSSLVGTPAYMSPEQVKGEEIDGRSDIYTLGVILYEMVVGSQPYEANTPMGVLFKHVHEPVPHLPLTQSELPLELDDTISRAMAKNVTERFQTAGEMATSVTLISRRSTAVSLDQLPEVEPAAVVDEVDEGTREALDEPETAMADLIAPPDTADAESTTDSEPTAAVIEPMVEPEPEQPVPDPTTIKPEPTDFLPASPTETISPPVVLEPVPWRSRLPVWAWVGLGVLGVVLLLGAGWALFGGETAVPEPAEEAAALGQTIGGFVQAKWEEGFRVTDLSYGDGRWAVIMSQDGPYGRQTWQTKSSFPGDYIQEKWEAGFRVTSLAYGNGVWAVMMSQGTPFGRQIWQTRAEFPGDYIQEKWDEGFRVTSLAYGNGVWAVVMSEDTPYGRQTWQTLQTFPGDFIQQKWEEGFRVTAVAYGNGVWAVLLSQDSPYGRQTWQTEAEFPAEYIESKWNEGFRLTSLGYGNGVWAAMLSQEGPYGRQTWLVVPDF